MKILCVLNEGEEHLMEDIERIDNVEIIGREYNYNSLVSFAESNEDDPDIIFCSEHAGVFRAEEMTRDKALLQAIKKVRLKREKVRIVMLLSKEKENAPDFIKYLVSLGVFDIQIVSEYTLEDVKDWLMNPKSFNDVAEFIDEDYAGDNGNTNTSKVFTKQKVKDEEESEPRDSSNKIKKEKIKEKTIVKEKVSVVFQPVAQTTISVYNPKGGTGKTTLSCNLALALNETSLMKNKKICLVDLDKNSNLSFMLDKNGKELYFKNIHKYLELLKEDDTTDIEQYLIDINDENNNKLSFLSLSPSPKYLEYNLQKADVDLVISQLKRTSNIIIIDLPSGYNDWLETIFQHSTHVFLVSSLEGQSLKCIKELTNYLQMKKKENVLKDKANIILNNIVPDSDSYICQNEAKAMFDFPIYSNICYSRAVAETAKDPKINALEKDENFKNAVYSVVHKIYGIKESNTAVDTKSKAFLSNLFNKFRF